MDVQPLTPVIGAEIHGVEPARLDDATFADVEAALLAHQVLFFRDQRLDIDEHKALGARFGPLHVHPSAPPGAPGHPEILNVHADANTKRTAGDKWHSDVSCDAEPPVLSILHLHTLPAGGGGDTLFSSMYAAGASSTWRCGTTTRGRAAASGLRSRATGRCRGGARARPWFAGDGAVRGFESGRSGPLGQGTPAKCLPVAAPRSKVWVRAHPASWLRRPIT